MRRFPIALTIGLTTVAAGACSVDLSTPAPRASADLVMLNGGPCTFTTDGTTMRLDGDCTTTSTILIPDGFTLDGAHFTITAMDPAGDHFRGAVVGNGGATAYVTQLNVDASGLANVCDADGDRLRGIMFDGASGSITQSNVSGINQGPSGCQEGNAIEVRNSGANPNTLEVEIAHNVLTDWQKTGIVCNGDAVCDIHHNDIGSSATQANLAANSVQFGFGAGGNLNNNKIGGNTWCGPSDYAATAILLYDAAPGTLVELNRIDGNSDVGIYAWADGAMVSKNTLRDEGTDCNAFDYDIGIEDYGSNYPNASNTVTKNSVSGFDTPYDGVTGGKNRIKKPIPQP